MAARQAFSHESLGESSTQTSGSWPGVTTFTFTPDGNSDYFIFFSCLFTNNSGTTGHFGDISVYHDQGSVSVGYWATRAQEVSTPQDWFSVFCVHKSSFGASPGAQDYIVSINCSHAGDTTKIKNIRFLAIKADAADQYAASDASSATSGTAYLSKTTLTFTPASTGDYLLLASAVLTHGSAGASVNGRLNHSGGSIYGDQSYAHKGASTYDPFAIGAKITLAAASNTFTLQARAPGGGSGYIEQARVLALRLDKFDNSYIAQDFTGGSTALATDQDFLTLTQTPLALDHAIIAITCLRTESSTVSGYYNFCKNGVNYSETVREAVTSSGYFYAGLAVRETLAASSTTWKWRARIETAGTNVHMDDLLIVVLQLEATPAGGPTPITASFSAAVQKAITGTASANAAVQATLTATPSANAAVQKMLTALASADSAVQKALSTLSSADVAVQTARSLTASLDTVVAVLRSVQAGLDAVVQKAISAGFGADVAVQQAFMASASLDVAVQMLRIASANADVAVQIARSTSVGADVYVTAAGVAEVLASLDVAVQALRQVGTAFDVAVQASRNLVATADAVVLASLNRTVGAGAAVLATITAGVAASAAVAREYVATFSADAAVSRLMTSGVGLDVVIGNVATARPIIDLAGVYGPAAALAGSHMPTVSLRGVRAPTTALSGRTGKKP